MVENFGFGALVVAFVISLYGIAAAIYGAIKNNYSWAESARRATLLSFPLIALAALMLILLLVNGRYDVQFVYNVTSNSMPLYLKVTSLWGGQSGSLVFWSLLMSAFASAVMLRKWDRDREFMPWVSVVSLVTLVFFLAMSIFFENPFARFWSVPGSTTEVVALFPPAGASIIMPPDGRGLNPLLRHPGMVIHPPMLYLGFVSFVIPFAFAIAALVTGRTDDRWIRVTRRWTLVAWLFLSLGLLLGSRWAYDVLGWGGYWGWDPVEIAAFMPWLAGTAFLHSVMIQEKRGMFKRWNMVLVVLTYSLVIYGTFLTRSGVLSSVHAFAQSAIGPMFFTYIACSFLISMGLLLWRWNSLRAEGEMGSFFSRESFFLFNNIIFILILVICFVGVIFPLASEIFTGQKVTVGPPWYERNTGPLFALLLLLMGIAPLSAWGASTWKTLGKNLWKPLAVSLAVVVVVIVTGTRNVLALLGFWLIALVISVTLYEFYKGTRARMATREEGPFLALYHLAGRNRRRYGGYIIHLGVVVMALGIIGIEMFQTQTQGTLKAGESLSLGGYTITFKSLSEFDHTDGRNVARAVVAVTKNGRSLGELYPRRDYYYESQQSMTIPGVRSTMEDDLYVLLVDWQAVSANGTTFKIFHNPLINWLWVGGFIFIFGMLVAAWPDKDFEAERAVEVKRVPVTIGG